MTQQQIDSSEKGRAPGRIFGRFGLAVAVVWALSTLTVQPAFAEQIYVVANPSIAADTISVGDLKLIYFGESEFIGNQRLALFQYAEKSPLMEVFLNHFSTTANRYKTYWIKAVFQKGAVPPQRVGNAAEMLSKVAATPGGIGFVADSDLGDAKNVKVIAHLSD